MARKAIERYAVEWALRHFAELDFKVEDVGAWASYDILALDDHGELHIEVKGSSGTSATVLLTDGEVKHRDENAERVLVVVDEIKWEREGGRFTCSGGRARVWRGWEIDDANLVPTQYRYTLPSGGNPFVIGRIG